MSNCNYCGQITDPICEVRAETLVFCNEEHSQVWYNREVAKETEATHLTDGRLLIRGLTILWDQFPDFKWNISSDGETIIVWDGNNEDADLNDVKKRATLEALGWSYDKKEKGWSPRSPIYC